MSWRRRRHAVRLAGGAGGRLARPRPGPQHPAGPGRLRWHFGTRARRRPRPPAGAPTEAEPVGEESVPRRRRAEAVLMLSRGPLSARKLAALAGLADATEARTLVRQLNHVYDSDGRAIRVEEVAGGYQLLTRPQFAAWLRRLGHVPEAVRLTPPALETLAIVAYRQPVLRAEIEAIRGVACGEILRQLMERDLVRIGGRSEELGRPYLYATTTRFLQIFGLRSTDALPEADLVNAPVYPEIADDPPSPSPSARDKESDVSNALAEVHPDAETAPWPASASAMPEPSMSTAPVAIDEDLDEGLEEDELIDDEELDEDEEWDEETDDEEDDEDDADDDDIEDEPWEEVDDDDEEDEDEDEDEESEWVDDEEEDEEWDEEDEDEEEWD